MSQNGKSHKAANVSGRQMSQGRKRHWAAKVKKGNCLKWQKDPHGKGGYSKAIVSQRQKSQRQKGHCIWGQFWTAFVTERQMGSGKCHRTAFVSGGKWWTAFRTKRQRVGGKWGTAFGTAAFGIRPDCIRSDALFLLLSTFSPPS